MKTAIIIAMVALTVLQEVVGDEKGVNVAQILAKKKPKKPKTTEGPETTTPAATTATTTVPTTTVDPNLQCTSRPLLPIYVCNDTYSVSQDARLAYKFYDTQLNYTTAKAQCEADGAYLMMIKTRCDEYDIALIRKDEDLVDDKELWLGMEQTGPRTYTYDDGDTMTVSNTTGLAETTSRYHRFSSEWTADMHNTVIDQWACVIQGEISYVYVWWENRCSDIEEFICVCYDR